jgi:hypothetical protein
MHKEAYLLVQLGVSLKYSLARRCQLYLSDHWYPSLPLGFA